MISLFLLIISLTIFATAVRNQGADARHEHYPTAPFPYWGYPRPPPTTYRDVTDNKDVRMGVGLDRFFDSERKDRRKNKFINNQISSPDTRTILPEQLWYVLECSQILLVPAPGNPEENVFDSCMESV